MITLDVETREGGKNLGALRRKGLIPAIFYGKGKKATSITVDKMAFTKARAFGEATPIVLKTSEGSIDVLIHDIQFDPLKNEPIHIDFLVIDVTKEITVKVPLLFTGVSEAVKNGLGILVKVMHEIEVKALPKDLPHHIPVPLEKLKTLEDHIFINDLELPPGVKVVSANNEVVASVKVIKEEEVAPAAPVDLSTIEVMKKGKKEEEGAEAETPKKEEASAKKS